MKDQSHPHCGTRGPESHRSAAGPWQLGRRRPQAQQSRFRDPASPPSSQHERCQQATPQSRRPGCSDHSQHSKAYEPVKARARDDPIPPRRSHHHERRAPCHAWSGCSHQPHQRTVGGSSPPLSPGGHGEHAAQQWPKASRDPQQSCRQRRRGQQVAHHACVRSRCWPIASAGDRPMACGLRGGGESGTGYLPPSAKTHPTR